MTCPALPSRPTTLPMRMTLPNFWRSMDLVTRFTTRKTPFRFVSTTLSNSSSLIRIKRVSFVMPAFATKTSIGPSAASTSAIAASSDAASVTSAVTVIEPSGPCPDLAVTATRYPLATNSFAMANPMPRLPPVTKTVRTVSIFFLLAGIPLSIERYEYHSLVISYPERTATLEQAPERHFLKPQS